MTKYEIAKQFSEGLASSLAVHPRLLSESDHWLAGWDAGYSMRPKKNELLNEYLLSIGQEPMAVMRLQ